MFKNGKWWIWVYVYVGVKKIRIWKDEFISCWNALFIWFLDELVIIGYDDTGIFGMKWIRKNLGSINVEIDFDMLN